MYEGWRKNGKRVSLKRPKVIMTTKSIDEFWDEMKAFSANEYALQNTQVISNSDGGAGYSSERFREVYSQSKYPLRSEEHTSELQSRGHLVCRLLLEKKNTILTESLPAPGGAITGGVQLERFSDEQTGGVRPVLSLSTQPITHGGHRTNVSS